MFGNTAQYFPGGRSPQASQDCDTLLRVSRRRSAGVGSDSVTALTRLLRSNRSEARRGREGERGGHRSVAARPAYESRRVGVEAAPRYFGPASSALSYSRPESAPRATRTERTQDRQRPEQRGPRTGSDSNREDPGPAATRTAGTEDGSDPNSGDPGPAVTRTARTQDRQLLEQRGPRTGADSNSEDPGRLAVTRIERTQDGRKLQDERPSTEEDPAV